MITNQTSGLHKSVIHIAGALVTAVTAALMHGGPACSAQEICFPEGWTRALTDVRPLYRQDTLTICFLGDVMMHTAQIENARRGPSEFDFDPYFEKIRDKIEAADIAVANLEFTLAGEPYTGYPEFSAPDTLAAHLALCGIDVFLTANNHIYDKGAEGTMRTVEVLRRLEERYGIMFTGLAESEEARRDNTPLTIRRKGMKVALVNFTYGTNLGTASHWPKTNYMRETKFLGEAFSRAHEEDADLIIALPHWGDEYVLRHNEAQEETAEWLAGQGAGLIIGAHPHVVQDFADVGNVPVAYSLGNAVSNMSAPDTQLGLMATARLVRNGNGDISLLPLEFTVLWCSRPGGYGESYMVIPVAEHLGKRELWKGGWDYDKMTATYDRVLKATGIKDGPITEE
ncbi:MAG: CapA family protein [Bacteroidales bacterium]|nr:CapA family protein [Bacteroidales bacterium]